MSVLSRRCSVVYPVVCDKTVNIMALKNDIHLLKCLSLAYGDVSFSSLIYSYS